MTLEELLNDLPPARVVDLQGTYVPVDMSEDNLEIAELDSASAYEAYIRSLLDGNRAVAAYGGYLEKRNLYTSELFENDGVRRNIHLGVDIWAPAGTAVLAPLEGTVHGFDYNAGPGNFGPTIILKHRLGR